MPKRDERLEDEADMTDNPGPSDGEERYWRSLYKAEKAAGLLKSQEELDRDLRDAGRGHLIKR